MPETVIAWPTVLSLGRIDLPDGVDADLVGAARIIDSEYRAPGDTRHFVSLVDNHRTVFPPQHREALDALWNEVRRAIEGYLRDNFSVAGEHPLFWELFVLTAKPGDRLRMHAHPQRDLFACYYPRVDGGGALCFPDTRPWPRKWVNGNAAFFDRKYLDVPVKRGTLVIAPGYALHETQAFAGPGIRVTYGFFVNLILEKQYAPKQNADARP